MSEKNYALGGGGVDLAERERGREQPQNQNLESQGRQYAQN